MSANEPLKRKFQQLISQNYLKDLFPDGATNQSVLSIKPMPIQGSCNRMLVLSTSYKLAQEEKKTDYALRITKENTSERLNKEYIVLRNLKKQGFPVPNPLFVETSANVAGKPFVIMELISGQSLASQMVSSQERFVGADLLAKLLSQLHKLDASKILDSQTEQLTCREFRKRALKGIEHKISVGYSTSLSFLRRQSYLNAVRRLEKDNCQNGPSSLVHTDFGPDHVLMSKNGPVVIDCEGMQIGDPGYDVAWAYHIADLEGKLIVNHKFVSNKVAPSNEVGDYFLHCYSKHFGSVPKSLPYYKKMVALRLAASLDLQFRIGYPMINRIRKMRLTDIRSQLFSANAPVKSYVKHYESYFKNPQ